MKNYQCRKCGTLINSESYPKSYGCPSGGTHSWNDLGESGDIPYQCRKCGMLIYAKSYPKSYDCLSGGTHSWNKLN